MLNTQNKLTELEMQVLSTIYQQSKIAGFAHKNFVAGSIPVTRLDAEVILNELSGRNILTLDLYGKIRLTDKGKEYLKNSA